MNMQGWKQDAALRTYNALRETNPHLPPADTVTTDEVHLHMGSDTQLASVTLRVFVTLPEGWQAPA